MKIILQTIFAFCCLFALLALFIVMLPLVFVSTVLRWITRPLMDAWGESLRKLKAYFAKIMKENKENMNQLKKEIKSCQK